MQSVDGTYFEIFVKSKRLVFFPPTSNSPFARSNDVEVYFLCSVDREGNKTNNFTNTFVVQPQVPCVNDFVDSISCEVDSSFIVETAKREFKFRLFEIAKNRYGCTFYQVELCAAEKILKKIIFIVTTRNMLNGNYLQYYVKERGTNRLKIPVPRDTNVPLVLSMRQVAKEELFPQLGVNNNNQKPPAQLPEEKRERNKESEKLLNEMIEISESRLSQINALEFQLSEMEFQKMILEVKLEKKEMELPKGDTQLTKKRKFEATDNSPLLQNVNSNGSQKLDGSPPLVGEFFAEKSNLLQSEIKNCVLILTQYQSNFSDQMAFESVPERYLDDKFMGIIDRNVTIQMLPSRISWAWAEIGRSSFYIADPNEVVEVTLSKLITVPNLNVFGLQLPDYQLWLYSLKPCEGELITSFIWCAKGRNNENVHLEMGSEFENPSYSGSPNSLTVGSDSMSEILSSNMMDF